jgi:signal transduction histidine kinase
MPAVTHEEEELIIFLESQNYECVGNISNYNVKDNPLVEISYKNSILSIFNTGEQIDTKNLFIVFDKYFQENSSKDGFGLGLALVKEFCDKNRISINIDTLENGNRFNLNLKNLL